MQTLAIEQNANASYLTQSRLSAKVLALIACVHLSLFALLSVLHISPVAPLTTALMIDVLEATRPAPEVPPPTAPSPPTPRKMQAKNLPASTLQPLLSTQSDAAHGTDVAQMSEAMPTQAASASAAPTTSLPRFDADYLSNPAPSYPPLSRRLREEGKVMLRVWVDTTGRPCQIELKTSSGSPRLDQAAQAAVWRWQFIPARNGSEVVGAWVLVPITFVLKA